MFEEEKVAELLMALVREENITPTGDQPHWYVPWHAGQSGLTKQNNTTLKCKMALFWTVNTNSILK